MPKTEYSKAFLVIQLVIETASCPMNVFSPFSHNLTDTDSGIFKPMCTLLFLYSVINFCGWFVHKNVIFSTLFVHVQFCTCSKSPYCVHSSGSVHAEHKVQFVHKVLRAFSLDLYVKNQTKPNHTTKDDYLLPYCLSF